MCIAFLGALAAATIPRAESSEQVSAEARPIKVAVRRITETQYRHTIADVFGPEIKINARFEPEKREEGLLAIGSAQLSLTSSGFEQYFALASSISDQVLGDKAEEPQSVQCKPADPAQADDACARQFIESYGEPPLSPPADRIRNFGPPQDGINGSAAIGRLLCRAETRADQPAGGSGVPLQGGNGRTRSGQSAAISARRLHEGRARVVSPLGLGAGRRNFSRRRAAAPSIPRPASSNSSSG